MADTMAEEYRKDYEAHEKIDTAARALRELLADENACRRFGKSKESLLVACGNLEHAAAAIVRAWD